MFAKMFDCFLHTFEVTNLSMYHNCFSFEFFDSVVVDSQRKIDLSSEKL